MNRIKLALENEIKEILYLGKLLPNQCPPNVSIKYLRQFLVRRRKCLEILVTNGINFWIRPIPKSLTHNPYVTKRVQLSNNKKKIILMITKERDDHISRSINKTFVMDIAGNYELEVDKNDLNIYSSYGSQNKSSVPMSGKHSRPLSRESFKIGSDKSLGKLKDKNRYNH